MSSVPIFHKVYGPKSQSPSGGPRILASKKVRQVLSVLHEMSPKKGVKK